MKKSNEQAWSFSDVFREELADIEDSRGARGQSQSTVAANRTPEERGADSQLVGVAFSGGGIRSATFNLGVLQALAELNLLPRIDYLSTVSGGGYIGSWLAAWLSNNKLEEVSRRLHPEWGQQVDPVPPPQKATPPKHEPPPINFLREYSNYLTPRLGMFGADTWAAAATILRNLLLNLSILILALTAVLLLPRLAVVVSDWVMKHPTSFLRVALGLLSIGVVLVGKNLRSFSPVSSATRAKSASSAPKDNPQWFTKPQWIAGLIVPLLLVGAWFLSNSLRILGPYAPQYIKSLACSIHTPSILIRWLDCRSVAWMTCGSVVYFGFWFIGWLISRNDSDARSVSPQSWPVTLFFALPAGAVGGLLLWCELLLFGSFADTVAARSRVAALGTPLAVAVFILTVIVHIGLMGRKFPDEKREWFARLGGLMLVGAIGWAILFGFAVYRPRLLILKWPWLKSVAVTTWVASTLGGVFAGNSASTGKGSTNTKLRIITTAAPYVFVVGLLLLLSYGIFSVLHYAESVDPKLVTELCVAAIGGAWALSWRVDINEFSMHMLYRNRLVRCYLGASNRYRKPQAFTGFDPDDDVFLRTLVTTPTRSNPFKFTIPADQQATKASSVTEAPLGANVPVITAINLNSAPIEGAGQTFTVSGWGFAQGATVSLRHQDEIDVIRIRPTTFKNSAQILFSMDGNPKDGTWIAQVTNPKSLPPDKPHAVEYRGPYHIINASLNLVKGQNLAWQERKAASFMFTPRFSGFDARRSTNECGEQRKPDSDIPCAYRPTERYGYENGGPLLGTAMAISGAAASPNMGYYSSAPLAFLMTVFNVRLGWWFGNPLNTDKACWHTPGPKIGLLYLVVELLGGANDKRGYVYLSDGGHFENLALYELVRRRCRFIIVSDAGSDGSMKFGDLGNAIEKCRVDFGVDIEIDVENLRSDPVTQRSQWHCAVGKIRYDNVDPNVLPGILLYLKPSITGDEPADVLRYKAQCPIFPHQSTANQWFDECQFESYRALGQHIVEKAFLPIAEKKALKDLDLESLLVGLTKHWYPSSRFVQKSFTKHTAAYTNLVDRMRRDDKLKFLDAQVYAEWPDLCTAVGKERELSAPGLLTVPTTNSASRTWLPESEDELRAGFYFCNEVIQLFEDAYIDLNLEDEHDHPDNRGWMNLFLHWSWSGMFCATWAISAGIYGSRFQRFCERYLDLALGRVEIGDATPIPTDVAELNRIPNFLSPWEVTLIGIFLEIGRPASERSLPNLKVIPLRMRVSNPRDNSKSFTFAIGFALVQITAGSGGKSSARIVYFRIRNHIRKMGLARESLIKLSETYNVETLGAIEDTELEKFLVDQKRYLDEKKKKNEIEKEESIREALPSEEVCHAFRLKVGAIPKQLSNSMREVR